jgi:hypothetical protein
MKRQPLSEDECLSEPPTPCVRGTDRAIQMKAIEELTTRLGRSQAISSAKATTFAAPTRARRKHMTTMTAAAVSAVRVPTRRMVRLKEGG